MQEQLYIYNTKTGKLYPAEQSQRQLVLNAEMPLFHEPPSHEPLSHAPLSHELPSREHKLPSRREPKVVGRYKVKSINQLLKNVAAVGMTLIVTGMAVTVIWSGAMAYSAAKSKNIDNTAIAGNVISEHDSAGVETRESRRQILAEQRRSSVSGGTSAPSQEMTETEEALPLPPAQSNASTSEEQQESSGVREKLEEVKIAPFDPNAELPLIDEQYVTREMALALGFSEEFMTESRCKEFNETLIKYEINTPNRISNFVGQGMVETGLDNRAMPKNGNAGKYFQAGFIHVSLESNFEYIAERLGDPKIYSKGEPYVTKNYFFMSAGEWWAEPWKRMNERIDEGATCAEITKIVTGDANDPNMQRREDATNKALGVFENYYNLNQTVEISDPTRLGPGLK